LTSTSAAYAAAGVPGTVTTLRITKPFGDDDTTSPSATPGTTTANATRSAFMTTSFRRD
jgi:hypothetical protein